MLPLALFRERTFFATNFVAPGQTFTFTGFIFVISLFLQQVKHYSPSLTGVALLPSFGCALLATSLSGTLMPRIGAKRVMVMGLILSAIACFGFVMVDTQTSYVLLACLLAVLGFGLASVLPAMTEAAISHAPRAQSGIASGMLKCEQASGWGHRGRDPGHAGGQSADLHLRHASRLSSRRRSPPPRGGSCFGLGENPTGVIAHVNHKVKKKVTVPFTLSLFAGEFMECRELW